MGFCEEDEAAAACAWDVVCFVPCWEGRAEGGEARKAAKKVERKKGRWEDMLGDGVCERRVVLVVDVGGRLSVLPLGE